MALARLASEIGSEYEFAAATVDHGLRPDSAAEAEQTARWCAALGLRHAILRWAGEKPAAGVQAAARGARYRLLLECAAREGLGAILLAHTADDQAETMFLRLARGSGAKGLGAMRGRAIAAAGAGLPTPLLRPFLEISRARVHAVLDASGQDAADDPGNDDPRFERVRIRGLLAALEEQGILTREALIRSAARLRAAQDRLDAADRDAFDRAGGVLRRWGWIEIARPERVGASLAARLVRAAGAGPFAPDEAAAATAVAGALRQGSATLAGALLLAMRGRLIVCREPAALLGRAGVAPAAALPLAPGAAALFDERFRVRNVGSRARMLLPFGRSERAGAAARLASAPEAAFAGAPWAGDGAAWPAGPRDGLAVDCLLEERLAGNVIRFG
jgi:tRNA(Ile)-lysidine synthase